jgi:hypothetical protein
MSKLYQKTIRFNNKPIIRMYLSFLFIFVFSCQFQSLYAKELDVAINKAVGQLSNTGLIEKDGLEMVIEVFNLHSKKFDKDARIIQSSLYSALQTHFPKSRILLKDEAIAGVSSNAVLIKGTYQKKKGKIFLELQAINQFTGRMIAKSNTDYKDEQRKYENLIVVLPIEAPTLKPNVAKIYSKIFRSALNESGTFNLVAADAVDAIDADEIQKQYNCSREECSAIVAEQLNANWVITTQYGKATEKLFYLTGSLKDIKTGRTINEVAIEHDGDIETLRAHLEKLACQLSKTCGTHRIEQPIISGEALLSLSSEPKGKVFLNGIPKGETPIQIKIKANKKEEIILVAEGYADYTNIFELKPNEKRSERIELIRQRGAITIKSKPSGAAILVNGEVQVNAEGRVIKTPASVRLVFGSHILALKLDKFQEYKKTFRINKRDNGILKANLVSKPGRLMIRVPLEHKNASVHINDQFFGEMGGEFFKSFQVQSNIALRIKIVDQSTESREFVINVPPEGSKKIDFDELPKSLETSDVYEEPELNQNQDSTSDILLKDKKFRGHIGFGACNVYISEDSSDSEIIRSDCGTIGGKFFLSKRMSFGLSFASGNIDEVEQSSNSKKNIRIPSGYSSSATGTTSSANLSVFYNWYPASWLIYLGTGFSSSITEYTMNDYIFSGGAKVTRNIEIEALLWSFGSEYQFQNMFFIGCSYIGDLSGNEKGSRIDEYKNNGFKSIDARLSSFVFSAGYSF